MTSQLTPDRPRDDRGHEGQSPEEDEGKAGDPRGSTLWREGEHEEPEPDGEEASDRPTP